MVKRFRLFHIRSGQDEGKLLASDTRRHVPVPYCPSNGTGKTLQNPVARLLVKNLVKGPEIINVQHQVRQGPVFLLARQQFSQPVPLFFQTGPIVKPGQGIDPHGVYHPSLHGQELLQLFANGRDRP